MQISLPYRYTPRNYQVPAYQFMIKDPLKKRVVIEAHRRWGKDLLCLNLAVALAHQRIGNYWHILPLFAQGRTAVWTAMDKEGNKYLSHIPEQLVENKHENTMSYYFRNGSTWTVLGCDSVNRLVGSGPVGVVFSEYALCDPAVFDYIRPILKENEGWAMFISTIRGKNHFYRLARLAEKLQAEEIKDGKTRRWFHCNHTVLDTIKPDGTRWVTDEDLDQERREGMSEAMIQQEYFNNPESALEGAYFGEEMNRALKDGRIRDIPYEPKLRVNTAWDIGVRDATSIIFFQEFGNEIRIIDYIESSGEALRFYIRKLKEKEYVYGKHYAPHDISVREWTHGNSRLEVARQLGVRFTVTQRTTIEDQIEQARSTIPKCWIDGTKCERLIDALRAYRKEKADDKLGRTSEDGQVTPIFKDQPLHDWSSHGASAFMTLAWNCRVRGMDDDGFKWPEQTAAVDAYNYV